MRESLNFHSEILLKSSQSIANSRAIASERFRRERSHHQASSAKSGELEALRRRQVDVGDEGTGVGGVGEQACGHQRGAQSALAAKRTWSA